MTPLEVDFGDFDEASFETALPSRNGRAGKEVGNHGGHNGPGGIPASPKDRRAGATGVVAGPSRAEGVTVKENFSVDGIFPYALLKPSDELSSRFYTRTLFPAPRSAQRRSRPNGLMFRRARGRGFKATNNALNSAR
jgi:hypothetical protein